MFRASARKTKVLALALLIVHPTACDEKDEKKDDRKPDVRPLDAKKATTLEPTHKGDGPASLRDHSLVDAAIALDRAITPEPPEGTLPPFAAIRTGDGTVVMRYKSWRHELGELETEELVMELYLERIKLAMSEHRSDWKPMIDLGKHLVEFTFEVPIDPTARRLYEASIRLFLSKNVANVRAITPYTTVYVYERRNGLPWEVEDLEAERLTSELQRVLDDIQ